MARENQGIQITLIIFVVLTLIFGATTWYFYQKSTEQEKRANDEKQTGEKARQEADAARTDAAEMAKLILGPGATGKLDDAKNQLAKDVQIVGAGFTEDKKFYSPMAIQLGVILAEKNAELKAKNDEIAAMEIKYKSREASKDPEIKAFRESSDKATQEMTTAKKDFDDRRAKAEKDAADAGEKLATVRKEATTEQEKLKEEIKQRDKTIATLQSTVEEKSTIINEQKRTIVDVPDADIRWVNQRSGLVWINVGRADGLQPLMTFSVYPADISDLSKGARKGMIEVTQILGDHMAEARITDDSITDPLMPGDKVDTALWNPGEQLHFALAGLMDVDGDGRNDLELVKNLITMNNGVVDAYEDEKGSVHGLSEMSINTRFLVKGGEGKKESLAAITQGLSKMNEKAKELGVQTISLQDLLQRMGYKASVSTKAGDEDKDAAKYRPKAGNPASGSRSSDLFQPPQP